MKTIPVFLVGLACISAVLAGYGELRRTTIDHDKILEFQLSDGTWGTVCNKGFNYDAAKTACKQLGYSGIASYDKTYYYGSYYYNPPVICGTYCYGYESRSGLTSCDLTLCSDDYYTCSYIITLDCYYSTTDDYYDHGSTHRSIQAIRATIGGVIGGTFIVFLIIFISLRICIRYANLQRNRNRSAVVTQQQTPRVMTRVTRTVSSDPPQHPTSTSSATNPCFAQIPPKSYQPANTGYAAAYPTNDPSDNIPSYPPPEYTPAVPPPKYTPAVPNTPVPVPPDSTQ